MATLTRPLLTDSLAADDVARSRAVYEIMLKLAFERRDELVPTFGNPVTSGWLPFSEDVNFNKSNESTDRLGLAFGKCKLEGQMKITVSASVDGPVISGYVVTGSLRDLYDFSVWTRAVGAPAAARVQAAHATLGTDNQGKVFFPTVVFNAPEIINFGYPSIPDQMPIFSWNVNPNHCDGCP